MNSVKHERIRPLNWLSALVLLAACRQQDTLSGPPSVDSPAPSLIAVPSSASPDPVPTVATTLTMPGLPTDVLTPTPVHLEAQPPPGLLVALGDFDTGWGLWLAESDGSLRRLLEQIAPARSVPDFDVSPDGQQILYSYEDDVWLFDLSSGEARNITQTPDRLERVPRWWPDRADGFVCGSAESTLQAPWYGYLTLISFEGEYRVLDDEGSLSAPPAPSPDSQTIAYTRFDQEAGFVPALYHLDQGAQLFDLAAHGISWAEAAGQASWSPDGQQLGWGLGGTFNGEFMGSLVIFDLRGSTHQVLHRYRPVPMGDFLRAPLWLSASTLVFFAPDDNPTYRGVWAVELPGGEPRLVGPQFSRTTLTRNPVISLDRQWIAAPSPYGDAVGLLKVGEWEPRLWYPPQPVIDVGWAAAP